VLGLLAQTAQWPCWLGLLANTKSLKNKAY
jgi:hypothetical protein